MSNNSQNYMVEKIRTQYMEKESTELDALRKLDARVKKPANVFAYVFGSLGAIIMGSGMSFIMTDLGVILGITGITSMIVGIMLGLPVVLLVSIAYNVYNRVLKKEREKIAPEILRLTEELMK